MSPIKAYGDDRGGEDRFGGTELVRTDLPTCHPRMPLSGIRFAKTIDTMSPIKAFGDDRGGEDRVGG